MKNLIKKTLAITLAASGLMLSSCKKEADVISNDVKKTQFAEQLNKRQNEQIIMGLKAHNLVIGLFSKSDQSHLRTSSEKFDFPDCAIVSIDSVSYPRTALVDLNTIACQDPSDKIYTGTIEVTFWGDDFKTAGEYAIALFNNVTIDGVLLNGTIRTEYSGLNASNRHYGAVDFNLTTSGKWQEMVMNGNNELILEDMSTGSDRLVHVTGIGTGTTTDGFAYVQTITQPLVLSDCEPHFVEGIVKLESPSFDTKFIDYGDGTCDNIATVIQGPSRNDITLD